MSSSDADTVSYADLAREALAYVRFNARPLLISAGVGLLAAILVAHFTPLQYRASVMVAAQEGLSTGSTFSNLEDFAGLASNVESGPFRPFERFAQTITNVSVAEHLTKQSWVLPAVFPNQWNPETQTWHAPEGALTAIEWAIGDLLGLPAWHPPDADVLHRMLDRHVAVDKFGRNPAYTISFEWREPTIAARLLDLLLKTNDSIIQHDAQQRLNSTIAYLQQRLKVETEINRLNALHQLLLEQERFLMAAEASGPYAAKIIDRMSVTVVALRKLEFGAAAFLLVFLFSYYGIKVTHNIRSGVHIREALRLQTGHPGSESF